MTTPGVVFPDDAQSDDALSSSYTDLSHFEFVDDLSVASNAGDVALPSNDQTLRELMILAEAPEQMLVGSGPSDSNVRRFEEVETHPYGQREMLLGGCDRQWDAIVLPSVCGRAAATLAPTSTEWELCKNTRAQEALLSWYTMLNEWIIFTNIHKHGNVPQSRPKSKDGQDGWSEPLAHWVNKNRREKAIVDAGNPSKYMYAERIDILERVDFRWGKQKDVFDDNYKKLVIYHGIVGNADVPVKPFDERLGNPVEQVKAVIMKLRPKLDVDSESFDDLLQMLLDRKFTRWITMMRDEYKKWKKCILVDPLTGLEQVPEEMQRKFAIWEPRKKKLDDVGFRFVILERNRA